MEWAMKEPRSEYNSFGTKTLNRFDLLLNGTINTSNSLSTKYSMNSALLKRHLLSVQLAIH